ncbi:hypothetical protein CR969_00425 [Candidatus Saccharibacteria bacterium]|nr:MAG: hypothetical protein CR969_00425 [Candidatus Saccharibacteria bacterium]
MKNSPSLDRIPAIIGSFIKRYHLVIYSLTVVVGVSIAIWLLYGLVGVSTQTDHPLPKRVQFDKETIEKIESFTTPDKNTKFTLPSGRVNPFK